MEPPETLLPPPPARIARFGGRSLNGAGHEAPASPWDAAVVAGEARWSMDWARLATSLRPDGKLLVEAPPAGPAEGAGPAEPAERDAARDALEIALAAAGFALRRPGRDRAATHPEWLQGTRTPFRVHGFQEGQETAILDLFERSFHHRRGVEHWRWQYRENPSQQGPPRITLATDPEDHLVAHYAGYPVTFQRQGTARLAHQIGDTMTAPEVRHIGRGPTSLLARCGHHFYARYCRRQVAFNYGFNVGNIQKFSMRFLGAYRVEDVPYWSRPAAAPLPPSATGLLGRPRYRVERDALPDARWDRLFDRVATPYGALVQRTARYLRWRYRDRPGFDYRILTATRRRQVVAWAVFRRDGDRLLWGDLLVDPRHGDAARDLLAAALAHPATAGVATVEGWFTPRPAFLSPLLESLGFTRQPEPQGLALMCVPFLDPTAPEWLATELYYTMGDGDLF